MPHYCSLCLSVYLSIGLCVLRCLPLFVSSCKPTDGLIDWLIDWYNDWRKYLYSYRAALFSLKPIHRCKAHGREEGGVSVGTKRICPLAIRRNHVARVQWTHTINMRIIMGVARKFSDYRCTQGWNSEENSLLWIIFLTGQHHESIHCELLNSSFFIR